MRARWRQLRRGVLSNASLKGRVCDAHRLLEKPATRNFATWNTLGKWLWGCEYVKYEGFQTYLDEVDSLLYFVLQVRTRLVLQFFWAIGSVSDADC